MRTFICAIVLSSLIIPAGAAFAQSQGDVPSSSPTPPAQGNPLPPQGQPDGAGQFQQPGQFPQGGSTSPSQGGPAWHQGDPNFQGQGGGAQPFRPGFMQGADKSGMPGPGGNFQGGNDTTNGMDPNQMQQRQEQQQKQQDDRMIAQMQQGSKQMERQLTMVTGRIKKLQSQGAVIPADLQSAIDNAKAFIEKIKNVKTSDEIQSLMEDNNFGDLMQTVNDGMQKAEMSTQFPRMLKEANKNLKQQQSLLK